MLVHNIQLGVDVHWCDKHDRDDNKSNEIVGIHERFSNVEKEEVDLPEEEWIEETSLRLRGSPDKEALPAWEGVIDMVLCFMCHVLY